tara:strand:+ start:35916 stop:36776 length:861 start_codon:yes stop_codon:yes gene_type:complete
MLRSMTGFGRSTAGESHNKIEVQIKSVNSRFLDLKFRGLNIDLLLEEEIRNQISKSLLRGSIQVRVDKIDSSDSGTEKFNKDRYETIQNVLNEIHVKYGQRLGISDLITTSDLLISVEQNNFDHNILKLAISESIKELNNMRLEEGRIIQNQMMIFLEDLKKRIDQVAKEASDFSEKRKVLLKKKISELLGEENIDEVRIIQEVALLAERADISEEIVRCQSHFNQLEIYLGDKNPVGKRISFLIQEIGREINTIGSKSPQVYITNHVVEMKDLLEKIREQIQNVL